MEKVAVIQRRTIICVSSFRALHSWPGARPPVSFLALPHHHDFTVEAEVEVTHMDREIEFILMARWLEREVFPRLGNSGGWPPGELELGEKSCETLAELIGHSILAEYGERWLRVVVREDGGHGAAVVWRRIDD